MPETKISTRKISKVNLVRNGAIVLTFDDNKKSLVDKDGIQTAMLMGAKLATGASLSTEDSVHPTTGEVSPDWVRIAF